MVFFSSLDELIITEETRGLIEATRKIFAGGFMDKNSLQYQLYRLDDENEVNALIKDETIWLTQKSMSELFDVGIPAINKHLNNIFESGELEESSTISKMEIVQQEGSRVVKRVIDFYNLDAIISVGYRVNSLKATRFRQ